MALGDTIFALASRPGPAGVAVFRISGPAAGEIGRRLSGAPLPPPRCAVLRRLRDRDEPIDDALLIWFPAPRSFTGEDVLELQTHGGEAIAEAVLTALGREGGARSAEPGEFSRRALANGKLDLTRVEAIAELTEARSASQRRAALRRLDGALSELARDWRSRTLDGLAAIEAEIDFAAEDEPPDGLARESRATAAALIAEWSAHLDDPRRGERSGADFAVAVLGAPNAGKSTLFNALARRDAAIVTETPGTTRDVLETELRLGDARIRLADTAGLRATSDPVEAIGVARARAAAGRADLALWVLDAAAPHPPDAPFDAPIWLIWNKSDIRPPDRAVAFSVSARSGDGVAELAGALAEAAAKRQGAAPLLLEIRHGELLARARDALATAQEVDDLALLAEGFRAAAEALAELLGERVDDAVLDRIFARFCIGK